MKITLELHKEGDLLLLNSQDIYKYIGEETEAEIRLAYYIDKWCQSLNYPFINNDEMMFGDPFRTKIDGWIDGYNYAKGIIVEHKGGVVIIHYGKHTITLNKPFRI